MDSAARQFGSASTGNAELIRAIIQHARQEAYDISPAPLSSAAIRHIASLGLAWPDQLSPAQMRKLCPLVLAHGGMN